MDCCQVPYHPDLGALILIGIVLLIVGAARLFDRDDR